VNFLGDEGAARVRDAYPGSTWDRLAAIKARYDPTNLFRLNQNIPPAGRPLMEAPSEEMLQEDMPPEKTPRPIAAKR